ncbi:GNAT family N-acetyltransferase [Blautia sp. An81]|uniref:GNAT family N-acetyltransferase n=1 Tax=Blautia sp. An81 TaxID=1965659 RepID=UPI000B374E70|nr:GNAT family protein [Blautia sp. An81]OUN25659.1 GNAT family N-acetyltransferase [Blautia sp. An81]
MLRRLHLKDAEFMLEWMHDSHINSMFNVNFESFLIEDARNFILNSFDEKNHHFAVVDENDEYLGTISLKNISLKDRNAEYAVVLRKKAHGTGVSNLATREILDYAFNTLKLERVYLNVLEENMRARAFYEKMGFTQEGVFKKHKYIRGSFQDLFWFGILKESYEDGN